MNPELNKINVLIADDHSLFTEGLVSLLQHDENIRIVGSALNGQETLSALQKNPEINVLLSDINMPDMNGIELCRRVRKMFPQVYVIALSMHDEIRIISTMLKAGATGYLLKKTNHEQLTKAIKTVNAGKIFVNDETTKAMFENLSGNGKKNFIPQLTSREKEVLKFIALEYTTKQISELLFISAHTVTTHRKKLLFKFDSHNTAGLIIKASEVGMLD